METTVSTNLSKACEAQRTILCRFVFAFIFFFLFYYSLSNTMVHQLQSPVLIFPYIDITYWCFHFLGIPEFITHHYMIACCFDLCLFTACIMCFVFPQKRFFIIAFFTLYLVYYIIFNSYGTQHTHSKAGILLIPLPFMVPQKMFYYMWEAMRYFTLFIYADAFLWKLKRFDFFNTLHGSLVMKKNFAAYLSYNESGIFAGIITRLLEHPLLIQFFFIIGFIMEGCFIIGFFTKRFDKYLFVISIFLPLGFLFFSDAFFFEMLVLSFTLIRFRSSLARDIRSV